MIADTLANAQAALKSAATKRLYDKLVALTWRPSGPSGAWRVSEGQRTIAMVYVSEFDGKPFCDFEVADDYA